jgi:ribosome assembly protein SQT1
MLCPACVAPSPRTQVFSGHSGPVTAGAFTPDGRAVVSAGGDNDCSLRVWNPKTGECSLQLSGHNFHQEGLTCLGMHQDGAVVLTGAQDGSVCVSNITNSRVMASLLQGTCRSDLRRYTRT